MSLWHADMNAPALAAGANLTVFSPHRVVRVVSADQLSIEMTSGDRLSANVLDRTGSELTLALPDGGIVHLSMVADDSVGDTQPGHQFSHQDWVVN